MARILYKILLIVGTVVLFLLTSSSPGRTKTMYVTDSFQITFRSGKGTDFKIMQMLSSGTPVKILREEDEWSQVELVNGQEGWLLTRYLMAGPPKSITIEQLNRRLEAQQLRIDKIVEENVVLKKSNKELLTQAESFKKDWETTRNNYEELLAESSEFLDVKKNYQSLKADHEHLIKRHQLLQSDNEKLKKKTELYWFLAGSLMLLIGLIVGISMGRLQRKKKSLYP